MAPDPPREAMTRARERRVAAARGGAAPYADLWHVTTLGAALVLWVALAVPYARLGHSRTTTEGVNDFTILYYSAHRAASARPLYGPLSTLESVKWPYTGLGNLNLPHTHLLLVPLAAFSYKTAAYAWELASLLALFGSLVLVRRELRLPLTMRGCFVGGAVLFGSAPYTSALHAGEISLLLMAPFTLAWISMRRGRWIAAGAWLGACAALKPFLGLYLIWLAVTGRWPAIAACVATLAGCVLVGMAAFGVGAYGEWWAGVASVGWWWPPENASLRGVFDRLFVAGHGMRPAVEAPELAPVAWAMTSALMIIATVWTTRARDDRASAIDASVVLLFSAALLVSPLGWIYYVPMFTGALVALWLRPRPGARPNPWLVLTVVLFLVPLPVTELGQPSILATLLLACAYSWALTACWIGAAWTPGASDALAAA